MKRAFSSAAHSFPGLAVTVLCLLCFAVLSASAQLNDWDVIGEEGVMESVTLVGLRGDSLVVSRGTAMRAIPVAMITGLKRSATKNQSETGAVIGVISGLIIGGAASTTLESGGYLDFPPWFDFLALGGTGALLGGGLGTLVGLTIDNSKSFNLAELSIPARLLLIEEILAGAR